MRQEVAFSAGSRKGFSKWNQNVTKTNILGSWLSETDRPCRGEPKDSRVLSVTELRIYPHWLPEAKHVICTYTCNQCHTTTVHNIGWGPSSGRAGWWCCIKSTHEECATITPLFDCLIQIDQDAAIDWELSSLVVSRSELDHLLWCFISSRTKSDS